MLLYSGLGFRRTAVVLRSKRLMVVADWSDCWGLRLSRATHVVGVNGTLGPLMFGVYLALERGRC